jgi:hypothetical protein
MLLLAHSGLRYLVLLLGVVVMAYSGWGLATKRPYDKTMRILGAAFTGVLDLTILLGFANLFFGIGFYPQLGGHIVMMVLAAAVAHAVSVVTKRRPPERRTWAPHLVGTAIVLAIVAGGILAIGRPIVG